MEISVENLVGKQVFIVLRDVKTLASAGFDSDENIFIIRGHEPRHGIWVEVPYMKNCPVMADGKSLEDSPAVIFVPWHHVVSVVHFPGRENLKMNTHMQRRLGFRQKQE